MVSMGHVGLGNSGWYRVLSILAMESYVLRCCNWNGHHGDWNLLRKGKFIEHRPFDNGHIKARDSCKTQTEKQKGAE